MAHQAHQWLLAGLKEWVRTLDDSDGVAQQMLTLWRDDPDFAQVREADAIDKMMPDEREDWSALWNEVHRALGK